MTQWRREIGIMLNFRNACLSLDFELSCQIVFGIPQTPRVDSCTPLDIPLITEKCFDIRRQIARGWDLLWAHAQSKWLVFPDSERLWFI